VQLKDNQPTLHQASAEVAATTTPLETVQSHDIGRNRDERRTVSVFAPAQALASTDWQPHVAAIIRVEREVFTRGSKSGLLTRSAETAFYISNAPVTAAAIRAHWRIETTSHYSRDVTMGEDRSRIRCNPGIAARLRSFAFNILKANRNATLSQDRYRAALGGLENLFALLAFPQR
jgi:hypothetical protein